MGRGEGAELWVFREERVWGAEQAGSGDRGWGRLTVEQPGRGLRWMMQVMLELQGMAAPAGQMLHSGVARTKIPRAMLA